MRRLAAGGCGDRAVGEWSRGEILRRMLQHPRALFRPWISIGKVMDAEVLARQELAPPAVDVACGECTNADLRRCVGQTARETALRFSWQATTGTILETYQAMLEAC